MDLALVPIARSAVLSLHTELVLAPKPGLVCPGDNGSHSDMNATTLFRSLFSLRHYFASVALAGYRGAPFAELQRLGIAAEARMLAASGGVNTHRGAIFNLGLLAAAAAHLLAQDEEVAPAALGYTIRNRWGDAICAAEPAEPSHGLWVAARYGAGGARLEAARGYPSVLQLALPQLRDCLRQGLSEQRALLHTLFVLIAELEDTNLLYRGGAAALQFAQAAAGRFLAGQGAFRLDWHARALVIRNAFVARRISPGGAADLLAATWFVHLVSRIP